MVYASSFGITLFFAAVERACETMCVTSDEHGQKTYEWTIGSLYSGCGIVGIVAKIISALVKRFRAIEVSVWVVYQVEHNDEKRQHLLNHTNADHTFKDVDKLHEGPRHWCYRVHDYVRMPWQHTLTAGFPCTSRTPMNKRSSEFKSCCQDSTGATGQGWNSTKKMIETQVPNLVILENIIQLMESRLPMHFMARSSLFRI